MGSDFETEPAAVVLHNGLRFLLAVPSDPVLFRQQLSLFAGDGVILIGDAAILWSAVAAVVKGAALAQLAPDPAVIDLRAPAELPIPGFSARAN